MPYAFGRNLEALPSTDASRHELLLFQFCEGDLPSMVLGFEEAVTQKLANVPAAQRKNYYEWSDVRFPEWIEQWWTANPPPHLPIG